MEVLEVLRLVLMIILGTIALSAFGIIFGLIYKGIDRKISAHMQGRIGPPIRQPFRDVIKLFAKENIVPETAIPWIFNLAPFIGLIATISILLFLPVGGFDPLLGGLLKNIEGNSLIFGDLVLILYLLIIPSLALVIGGFASGSPYAVVGAQREMAAMIAYEFPLAVVIVSIAWLVKVNGLGLKDAFTITAITSSNLIGGIWGSVGIIGFIGLVILLFALVIVTPAELSKIPFDAPEAETEIAGGLLTEYSGRNLALFYLMDAVKTVVMASLVVAIFFPFNLSQILSINGYVAYFVDVIFYLIKVFLVILFSITLIRVAVARLKIDQIVYTYWIWVTLLALIGLILIMWDRQLGLVKVIEMIGLS